MTRRALTLLVLVVAAFLPGCVLVAEPDPDRVVEGVVNGDGATSQYYKVYLRSVDGYVAVADFDRRDWYVAGLERAVQQREVDAAAVQGQDRGLLNEVVVRTVLDPLSLNDYHYENMAAYADARGEPFDRAALDREWDARLAELARLAEEAARGGASEDAGAAAPIGLPSAR